MNYKIWKAIANHKYLHGSASIATIKHILTVLVIHADENGDCFPKLETIMRESGRGQRTVENALRAAESAGFFTVLKRGLGRGNPTTYRLHPTQGGDLTDFIAQTRNTSKAEPKAANRAQNLATETPQTVPVKAANRAQKKPQSVRSLYKDEVPVNEVPEEVACTPHARAPEATSSPFQQLHPLPHNDTEQVLCEVAAIINPERASTNDRTQWPIALDTVTRSGASADDLRAFRDEWFASLNHYGQPRRALYLSNIVMYLPQWISQRRAHENRAKWQEKAQQSQNARFTQTPTGEVIFDANSSTNFAASGADASMGAALTGTPFAPRSRDQRIRDSHQNIRQMYAERFGAQMGGSAD